MAVTAPESNVTIERSVIQLFALVSEAIARSTEALLGGQRGSDKRWSTGIRRSTILTAEWRCWCGIS